MPPLRACARGESLDSILRAYPQHANTMREPLSALQPVLAIPFAAPSPQSRANASARHVRRSRRTEVATARRSSRASGRHWARGTCDSRRRRQGLPSCSSAASGLRQRPGDRSPVPVPGFLHVLAISSDNAIELRGTIVALDANAITLQTSSGNQSSPIDAADADPHRRKRATAADLALGQDSRRARHARRDGTLRAARISADSAAHSRPGSDSTSRRRSMSPRPARTTAKTTPRGQAPPASG